MTEAALGVDAGALRRLVDEAEIRQLSVSYALATDAIGTGDLAQGRDLYRRTFTADAQISAGKSAPVSGPDGWAEYVTAALSGYTATQHLIGTIDVTFNNGGDSPPRSATMSTYLCATHERTPGGEIYVVLGTYSDELVRTPAGWRIARRTLTVTSTERRHA